ncbi:DNA integrity scanning protein DisA nucleotide-binding domain protein [Peribacillus sp. NPDC097295]|uniref:DNA integrity scanning protein DisA nucleotide-binding domain protein n=1 Tax=Peribacillus sp. NPDC097295 TaxID=3364402 RepID=UPI0038104979
MYIWGFQPHFQISINVLAENIFNSINSDLKAEVSVIGLWNKEKYPNNPNGIDIVTVDSIFQENDFIDILKNAELAYQTTSHMLISDSYAEKKYHEGLKLLLKSKEMEKKLNQKYCNNQFFVAKPVEVNGYFTFIVLHLEKHGLSKIPKLTKEFSDRYKIYKSYLEATIQEFLSASSEVLNIPDIGQERAIRRPAEEFIKGGAKVFLENLLFQFKGSFNLYESFNIISSQYYEGAESKGGILIGKVNSEYINKLIEFKEPISLKQHRTIRKLLEMTNDEVYLLSDGDTVYGLGKLSNYDKATESIFIIKFVKHYLWQLVNMDEVLMEVEYGNPKLPIEKIDYDQFKDTFFRIFKDVSDENIQTVWSTIISASKQKHGTMVVISSNAKEEATRLGNQCLKINETIIDSNLIEYVTSIDGAILINPNGECVALGVILDGVASNNGDMSRGARYNSAIRYLETQQNDCLIVVISEDGYINLIPTMKPRIPKVKIETLIEKLRELNRQEIVDIKCFNLTMSELQALKFYLLEEDCNEINDIFPKIQEKMQTNIKIVYEEFQVNAYMNESYYL